MADAPVIIVEDKEWYDKIFDIIIERYDSSVNYIDEYRRLTKFADRQAKIYYNK